MRAAVLAVVPMRARAHVLAWVQAWVLMLMLAALAAPTGAAPGWAERLQAARELAGANPRRAVASLQPLRDEAQGRLDWRLMVDEVACRVLSDIDVAGAEAVARAGLAAAGTNPAPPARLPWLRLRACLAGILADGEQDRQAATQELDFVLQASADDDSLRSARAVALVERGVIRSRNGLLLAGQQDLLAACALLKPSGPDPAGTGPQSLNPDLDLCLSHLANHYRRMGDHDEALRLSSRLRDEARQRGAMYDESIHLHGLAQSHRALGQLEPALQAYRDVMAVTVTVGDVAGQAFAASGIGAVLVQLKRPAEALAQMDLALQLLDRQDDPRQRLIVRLERARLLAGLDRAPEALAELRKLEPAVRQRQEADPMLQWWNGMADAQRMLGQWREAYQALAEARRFELQLKDQHLSEQAARLRMQFNRNRDAEDLDSLRRLNEQGQRLRETQALALALFVVLLAGTAVLAWRKFGQARRLHSLASTDELTGLPNRRTVLHRAGQALQKVQPPGSPMAVLMIDVDHFKSINDRHGHAVGDGVLRQLATVLPQALRGQDTLGRLGGEEFLAVLPDTTLAQAAQVAERMRAALAAAPVQGPEGPLPFTVSIGVAARQGEADTVAALVERADAALYRAKSAGRDCVRGPDDEAPGG